MLTICLLALPWMADPTVTNSPGLNAASPIVATCARPEVKVIERATVSALSSTEISDSLAIATLLRRWERSVKNRSDWTRTEHEEFRERMKSHFNEHTVAAVEQLTGRVQRDWLCECYAWTIIERSSEQICIEAVARDDTERLFYSAVRVWLNTETCVPEQIIVVNRNQIHRVAWQSDSYLKNDNIELVRFEDDVPPAPRSLVRTADARVD